MVASASALIAHFVIRKPLHKLAFNISQRTITIVAAGLTWQLIAQHPVALPALAIRDFIALLMMATVYYVVNTGLVATILALVSEAPPTSAYALAFGDPVKAFQYLAMIPLALTLVALWEFWPPSVLLLILPTAVVRYSLQATAELRSQTRHALEALADIIDQRDPYTSQHSQRVAHYAELIAQRMGLRPDVVDTIALAARMHDLGKVGIKDAMLYKPGPLTPEEVAEFKRHSELGKIILENFGLFRDGAEMVLHDHERWDGTGYPAGLRGEKIPLGSRIIAVADAYDAMTTDRPYRRAMSRTDAINELVRSAGTHFDPTVVRYFLGVLGEPVPEELTPSPVATSAPQPVMGKGRV
jgi:HD-GYP domain-containing protein (c-di-GMP phosphodiesterase class II)